MKLPRNILTQLDNCSGERKNRYLLAYMEAFVHWGVFDEIEVEFLPVGHTQRDIDQSFSTASC